LTQHAKCPRYEALLTDFVSNSEIMKKINTEKQGLFWFFNFHSGLNITNGAEFSKQLDSLIVEVRLKPKNY